jgi:hypothetical protein
MELRLPDRADDKANNRGNRQSGHWLIFQRRVERAFHVSGYFLHALASFAAVLGEAIGYAFGLVGYLAELVGCFVLQIRKLVGWTTIGTLGHGCAVLREDCPDSQRHGTALVRAPGCTEFILRTCCHALRRVFGRLGRIHAGTRAFQGRADFFRPGADTTASPIATTRTRRGGLRSQRWQAVNSFKALSQALEEVKALPVAQSYLAPVAPAPSLSGHFQSSLVPAFEHDRSQKVARRQWR